MWLNNVFIAQAGVRIPSQQLIKPKQSKHSVNQLDVRLNVS